MSKVAFFVDGAFLTKRIFLFKSFFVTGETIREYCKRHLCDGEQFYRIFYYDAPPLDRTGVTPFGKTVDFGAEPRAVKMNGLLQSIRETSNMALRLGKVAWQNDWALKAKKQQEVISKLDATSLTDADFEPNFRQKAVDMKIGLDIATVTYKRLADRIVLIAGDADFSPAAKLARTEGMHVTLDPLGNKIPDDLLEHIDTVCCMLDPENHCDVDPHRKQFFVPCKKTCDDIQRKNVSGPISPDSEDILRNATATPNK